MTGVFVGKSDFQLAANRTHISGVDNDLWSIGRDRDLIGCNRCVGTSFRGIGRVYHRLDLLAGVIRILGSGEKSQARENRGQPVRSKLPFPKPILIGAILIAAGAYSSWYGLGSETLGIPSSLALILISLAVLDGCVLLLLSAFVSDAGVRL